MAIAEGRVCLNDAYRIPIFTALVLEREGSVAQEKSGLSFLHLCCRCLLCCAFLQKRTLVYKLLPLCDDVICSMGSLPAVRLLLEKKWGNAVERQDAAGRDSLGSGAVGRGIAGDRSGASGPSDINAISSSKVTALHIAARHRYMEIVKLLLLVPSHPSPPLPPPPTPPPPPPLPPPPTPPLPLPPPLPISSLSFSNSHFTSLEWGQCQRADWRRLQRTRALSAARCSAPPCCTCIEA